MLKIPMVLANFLKPSVPKVEIATSSTVAEWRPMPQAIQDAFGEFCTFAIRSAVVASMATARAQDRPLLASGMNVPPLPSSPLVFPVVAAAFANEDWRRLGVHIESFYARLEAARNSTPEILRSWNGWAVHCDVDWVAVETQWRAVCGEARMLLLVALEVLLPVGSDFSIRVASTEQLTKAARDGLAPCIRSNGAVIIPEGAESRVDARITLDVSAWLVSAKGRQRITLRDLSLNGIGLAGCPALSKDSMVVIELKSGRMLPGRTAWCHGGRAGIQLTSPLKIHDPLFTAALVTYRRAKRKDN